MIKIVALDVEESIPARTIILKRDLRCQLHQLFLGKLIAQTCVQLIRNIPRRVGQRVSQFKTNRSVSLRGVRSLPGTARSFSSLKPAFLPTTELMSTQKGQPTRAAARIFPN